MTDYATLARIEDHLRRIADALERPRDDRLSELVDIAQRGLDRVAASFRLDRGPDDTRLAMQDLAMELRAALESAHPKFNPGGLVQPPWDITSVPNRVELEPVPNQPGVFRRVKHAAWDDCETREAENGATD